jgi:hypothetical protein
MSDQQRRPLHEKSNKYLEGWKKRRRKRRKIFENPICSALDERMRIFKFIIAHFDSIFLLIVVFAHARALLNGMTDALQLFFHSSRLLLACFSSAASLPALTCSQSCLRNGTDGWMERSV